MASGTRGAPSTPTPINTYSRYTHGQDVLPVDDEKGTLENGQLHERANPWGKRFQEAVWRILGHNEHEWMARQANGKIAAIWEDEDLMETFVCVDMNFLRATVCTRQTQPQTA